MAICKNNTSDTVFNGIRVITLYDTRIVGINEADKNIVLTTGGYSTATTFRRMNEVLAEIGAQWRVSRAKGNHAYNFATGEVRKFDEQHDYCVLPL